MDEARPRTPPAGARPWFLWLTDAAPVSPVWVGGAISAVLLCIGLLIPARSHVPASFVLPQEIIPRIMVSFCIVTGLNVALLAWVERATLRDLGTLRSSLRTSDEEHQALERSLTHFPLRALWVAVAVGLAGHFLMTGSARGFSDMWPPEWRALFSISLWMVTAPATYILFSYAARFRRLARDLRELHLFDLRPLAPFSRLGLRTALFYTLGFTILFGAHRDWSADGIGIPDYVLWTSVVWVPLSVGLAMLPTWDVRQRIRAEKNAELDRVRAAMDGTPGALAGSSMAAHAAELRGVALLEYRDKVAAVREWPFDASGLRRLAFYVLIPPLGWLGGALVERVVDRVLQ